MSCADMPIAYTCLFCLMLFVNGRNSEETYWWRTVIDEGQILLRSGHYRRYLLKNPSQLQHIQRGTKAAVLQCRTLFRNDRWNCVSRNPLKPFGSIVKISCRETAFVYAITSAGFVYHMTKACSAGQVYGCHNYCLDSTNIDMKEAHILNATHLQNGKCDEQIHFSLNVWRRFVYFGESARDFRARFNIRNSQLGAQEVYNTYKLDCTCYGVSGNCAIQVCVKKLKAKFPTIGRTLYRRYRNSKFVIPDQRDVYEATRRRNKPSRLLNRRQRYNKRRKRSGRREESVTDLEYYEMSPDFCKRSSYAQGTQNRTCEAGPGGGWQSRACVDICCNGVRTRTIRRPIRSTCLFVYCCHLDCKEEEVQEYYCL